MATIYASKPNLNLAQQLLNEHTTATTTGRCPTCATPGPCRTWEAAATIFEHSLHLPHRIPGLTLLNPTPTRAAPHGTPPASFHWWTPDTPAEPVLSTQPWTWYPTA
ncbi:hypothetical protein K1W54_12530 [Micromonospora sp. CPCC 205371]|nr:hypothetical protein [Micromonospora sp. CPCC 205371]